VKKPKGYEIERVLVLSTAHIPQTDCKVLDENIVGTSFREGYLLSIAEDLIEARDWYLDKGISLALFELMQLTVKVGCTWLKLDADGPVREDLPVFEW
jgi:hypothetical protein